MKIHLLLLLGVAALVASGCAPHSQGPHKCTLDQCARQFLSPAGDFSIQELNRIADDSSAETERRCDAVLTLFGEYLKPGMTSEAIGKVIGNAKWLQASRLTPITTWMGPLPPVNLGAGTAFTLTPFPQGTNQSPSSFIFIVTSRTEEFNRAPFETSRITEAAMRFLRGQSEVKAQRLVEFALCRRPGHGDCSDVTVREDEIEVSQISERRVFTLRVRGDL